MSDLTLFVNTHSSCADLWPMFFGQLKKHWPERPSCVVAADVFEERFDDMMDRQFSIDDTYVSYAACKRFTSQYLMGLCAVETPYVLTLQEDMILYGDVSERAASARPRDDVDCLRLIYSGPHLAYSMQASVWHTSSLKALYAGFDADTPWDAELKGDGVMKMFSMKVAMIEPNGPKRGRDHYDNNEFPYIATALCRGKWNAEYHRELEPLHAQYDIDASKRGWTE